MGDEDWFPVELNGSLEAVTSKNLEPLTLKLDEQTDEW